MKSVKNKNSRGFASRLKSMLNVDLRRMFTQPLFYIMVGVSVVIPVLVLVMTTMMGTGDPANGEAAMEGFTNVWQTLGSTGGMSDGATMDLTSMCNINLIYFLIAVLVCVFVSADFRSGYVKNLFAIRSKKTDYVTSKTIVGFIGGAFMIAGYFIGSIIGGAIAGLSFELGSITAGNIVCCLISKFMLVPVFVSIFTLASVFAKQKLWLSILLSLGVGMFLFMMISIAAPLNAGIMNIILCLAGGIGFAFGLGAVSNVVLNKTNLV